MNLKRIHILGDEWLYYKVYCGVRTSDLLLVEAIKPLAEALLKQDLIDSWFFIRYEDPQYHLRIRFHLSKGDNQHIGAVINAVNITLKPYLDQYSVSKIQTDTYIRELERYGSHNIITSENLFFYNSKLILKAIEIFKEDELYFLFTLKVIDSLMDDFDLDLAQKINFVKLNMLAFKKEFGADKKLNKQMDKKYSNLEHKIYRALEQKDTEFLVFDKILALPEYCVGHLIQEIIATKSSGELETSIDHLLGSYIHMHVNRAFRSQQRFYELVCYDFLFKHYKAKSFRKS
ncbi:thiopeptide-type bacteriocin biosynthesis protein [Aquimarina sp. 2-A2]|uniref:thiopeptide-type bacteriocin biosynthesis protein n=1 Tax=Aquimarina sp. 2-A2 TaxID=3382644 RepID=UPI00387F10F1